LSEPAAAGFTHPALVVGTGAMALNPSMSVLLVDDSKLMINIIRSLLQHLGINDVDDANDGASALAKMRSKRYGLVISDWNMVPMSGYELLCELRNDPALKRTPFIMVTSESKTEEGRRRQLHRQAVQRPHAESQDRDGFRRAQRAAAGALEHDPEKWVPVFG
jgi:two-component system chemotaxis response regulator CheY